MPTKKRISVPGAIAHIMARGIDGVSMFNDDENRQYFLSQLAESIKSTRFRCYGWVLMNNHYHLVVRSREEGKTHGVGLADALIAATSTNERAGLRTFNLKHFPMLNDVKPPYKRY